MTWLPTWLPDWAPGSEEGPRGLTLPEFAITRTSHGSAGCCLPARAASSRNPPYVSGISPSARRVRGSQSRSTVAASSRIFFHAPAGARVCAVAPPAGARQMAHRSRAKPLHRASRGSPRSRPPGSHCTNPGCASRLPSNLHADRGFATSLRTPAARTRSSFGHASGHSGHSGYSGYSGSCPVNCGRSGFDRCRVPVPGVWALGRRRSHCRPFGFPD